MNSTHPSEQVLRQSLQTGGDEYERLLPDVTAAVAGTQLELVLRRIRECESHVRVARTLWEAAEIPASRALRDAVARHSGQLSRLIAAVDDCRRRCELQRDQLRPGVTSAARHRDLQRAYTARSRQ